MRLLLDTHVILWWLDDSPELSPGIKSTLDTEPAVYVSAVSPWEFAIKQSLGKLPGPEDLAERVRDSQFTPSRSQQHTGYEPSDCRITTGTPLTVC